MRPHLRTTTGFSSDAQRERVFFASVKILYRAKLYGARIRTRLEEMLTVKCNSAKPENPVDAEVRQAVRELSALRALTKSTANHTTFAQNAIIRKLSPVALTPVAVILAESDNSGSEEGAFERVQAKGHGELTGIHK